MSVIANYELYDAETAIWARFHERARGRGWARYATYEWSADGGDVAAVVADAGWAVQAAWADAPSGKVVVLAEGADQVVLLTAHRGSLSAVVGAESLVAAEKTHIALTEILPPVADTDDRVEIAFCTWDGRLRRIGRRLAVPTWDSIADGYAAAARRGFEALRDHDFAPGSGKLALWHGRPGTGKTSAVRALMDAWRDDVEFVYVTDPEAFFGPGGEYMLSLVLDGDDERRLVVIEDAAS